MGSPVPRAGLSADGGGVTAHWPRGHSGDPPPEPRNRSGWSEAERTAARLGVFREDRLSGAEGSYSQLKTHSDLQTENKEVATWSPRARDSPIQPRQTPSWPRKGWDENDVLGR